MSSRKETRHRSPMQRVKQEYRLSRLEGKGSSRFASHKGRRALHRQDSFEVYVGDKLPNRVKGDDYLAELHEKNKSIQNKNSARVDSYINDKTLNDYQKLEAIKRQANLMEEKARMKEKLIEVERREFMYQNNQDYYKSNVEKTIQVNDMYIDAINAKLKILDQI